MMSPLLATMFLPVGSSVNHTCECMVHATHIQNSTGRHGDTAAHRILVLTPCVDALVAGVQELLALRAHLLPLCILLLPLLVLSVVLLALPAQ